MKGFVTILIVVFELLIVFNFLLPIGYYFFIPLGVIIASSIAVKSKDKIHTQNQKDITSAVLNGTITATLILMALCYELSQMH